VKLLTAAVAAAVLALSLGTIWIGARLREETVAAHPYEEGLAYDQQRRALEAGSAAAACDLGASPCTRTLGDMELALELGPRPLRAMSELAVGARLLRKGAPVDGAEVRLSFAMAGMDMGENAVGLAPAGGGRYQGKAVLVRCTSGRGDWIATAVVRQAGEERRAAFPLRLGE
jgi:hypothetical protein